MTHRNLYKNTDNFAEWPEKDKVAYWKRKAEQKKEREVRNNRTTCEGIGLKDNDGW